MKRLLFAAVLLLPAICAGQVEVNFATTSGELFPVTSRMLSLTDAWLTAVSVNGAPPIFGGMVGPVAFTTPEFTSGSVADGGKFHEGGAFFISSPWGLAIDAKFTRGSWRRMTFADGTANYMLVAEIHGTLLCYGIWYAFEGHTAQIALALDGRFVGNNLAGGGTTDAISIAQ